MYYFKLILLYGFYILLNAFSFDNKLVFFFS